MEVNLEALLVESNAITNMLSNRCLLLSGQIKTLQDKLTAAQAKIEELEAPKSD